MTPRSGTIRLLAWKKVALQLLAGKRDEWQSQLRVLDGEKWAKQLHLGALSAFFVLCRPQI